MNNLRGSPNLDFSHSIASQKQRGTAYNIFDVMCSI